MNAISINAVMKKTRGDNAFHQDIIRFIFINLNNTFISGRLMKYLFHEENSRHFLMFTKHIK